MKLNSDDQQLAESKILLLYILSKVGKPISHNELLELVISISDMNYFYFQQFLLDLLENQYIARFDQEGIEIPYPHRVVISETKDKITKTVI